MRADDNELLTRVGPGTPMGNLMRQYWIPAVKSDELEADGTPIRLRLLGENLIAFRTTSGKVGIMDHRCPHRCASLFFGRNEEDGIRCVYHGWKFDVNGQCIETPTEPPDSNVKEHVHAQAYATQERGGVVWVYMGNSEELPELPALEASLLPDESRFVVAVMRECNWLQALEGDIDTAHLSLLHMGSFDAKMFPPGSAAYYFQKDKAPRYEVKETAYGTMYGAYRPGDDGHYYWRIAHFLMPFWTMPPGGPVEKHVVVRGWVPLDDYNMMFWHFSPPIPKRPPIAVEDKQGGGLPGIHFEMEEFLPNDPSDWLGRFRHVQNAGNDYMIDREVQRTQSYTGIDGVHMQDQAITESMGAIADRTREHLGTSDRMVMQTRRYLINAVKKFADEGELPASVYGSELYWKVHSGEMMIPEDADWTQAYNEKLAHIGSKPEKLAS